jgi:hypothetical protein
LLRDGLLRDGLLRDEGREDFRADFCAMTRDLAARTWDQADKETTTASAALFQPAPLASFRSLSLTDI